MYHDVYSVIVPANQANLSAHTYTQIYGGMAGCNITINGQSLLISSGSLTNITINNVSNGDGCYLLGEYNDNGRQFETPIIPPIVDTKILNVNFIGSSNTGSITGNGWNNVSTSAGSNVTSDILNWSDGTNSGVTSTFSLVTTINDNGATYGNTNTTIFPNDSLRMAVSIAGNGTLTFNNIPSGNYKISVLGSRAWNSSRGTTYSVNGAPSVYIEAQNNRTDVAVFDNVSPSGNTLQIGYVSTVSESTNVYVNAVIIEKK